MTKLGRRLSGEQETSPNAWLAGQLAWLAAMVSGPWWWMQTGHFWWILAALSGFQLMLMWIWAVNQ